MGDMAEYYLQQGMDAWLSGEYDDEGEDYTPRVKTCRSCRATNLEWGRRAGRWALFDSAGNLHVCRPKDVFK